MKTSYLRCTISQHTITMSCSVSGTHNNSFVTDYNKIISSCQSQNVGYYTCHVTLSPFILPQALSCVLHYTYYFGWRLWPSHHPLSVHTLQPIKHTITENKVNCLIMSFKLFSWILDSTIWCKFSFKLVHFKR